MNGTTHKSSFLYCTWVHRRVLPESIGRKFGDLDHFVKQLLANAQDSILIIAPYLTPDGIDLVKDSIFMSVRGGAWVRIVIGDIEDKTNYNKHAIQKLIRGDRGCVIKEKLRVLRGSKDLSILLHSKIIIVDSKSGYLGSANISFSAFEKNFEVGVELSADQATSMNSLVAYWESTGLLEDCTSTILDQAQQD